MVVENLMIFALIRILLLLSFHHLKVVENEIYFDDIEALEPLKYEGGHVDEKVFFGSHRFMTKFDELMFILRILYL